MFTLGLAIGAVFFFVAYRVGWYGGVRFEQSARLKRLKSIRELISKQAAKEALPYGKG